MKRPMLHEACVLGRIHLKIGIFVHSKTGNTFSVAIKLQEALQSSGHEASLLRITAKNDEEIDFRKIMLDENPNPSGYDVVIFGAPVRGFALSAVMHAHLNGIENLNGTKVALFLTQFSPFRWMGGIPAMNQFVQACKAKGALPYETGIINWSAKNKREKQIPEVIDALCKFGTQA